MIRTLRTIRRSIRAALTAGRHLVTAVRGARFGLLVRLYAAIDRGATVRIGYTDSKGTDSVRDITPHRLDATAAEENPVTATHPLLARLPEAHGRIVRTVPVGPGVVVVTAWLDGEFEITGWRPLDEWELASDRQAFPGEADLPAAAYVTAQLVAELAGVDAAVAGATAALVAYEIARDERPTGRRYAHAA